MPKKRGQGATQSGVPSFGGGWSLSKLDILERYFRFFNTALKGKPFKRVYIDGFAGCGAFQYIVPAEGGFFGSMEAKADIHDGSAKRALRAEPPFDEIILIEQSRTRASDLKKLIDESGHPSASVKCGDANEVLRRICSPLFHRRTGP